MPESGNDKEPVFYDIHCHVVNLSHPGFYAYIKRYLMMLGIESSWRSGESPKIDEFVRSFFSRSNILSMLLKAIKNLSAPIKWGIAVIAAMAVFTFTLSYLFYKPDTEGWCYRIASGACEAINGSPSFYKNLLGWIFAILALVAPIIIFTKNIIIKHLKPHAKKIINILAIMERSEDETLFSIEDDIPVNLKIGNVEFKKYMLTPLIIDFWAKTPSPKEIRYRFTPKSIVDQIEDLLWGISNYAHTLRSDEIKKCESDLKIIDPEFAKEKSDTKISPAKMAIITDPETWEIRLNLKRFKPSEKDDEISGGEKAQHLSMEKYKELLKKHGPQKRKLMAIPFMGLNTRCCYRKGRKPQPGEGTELDSILNKYFNSQSPSRRTKKELMENYGKFEGKIDDLGNNVFVGVKLYPPTGFDPWPDDEHERDKVKYLYEFCCEHNVPLVSHCSPGGFIEGSEEESKKRAHPSKWETPLSHYKNLKLDLAHFGQAKSFLKFASGKLGLQVPKDIDCEDSDENWAKIIISLIQTYDNVYTDISYMEGGDFYYNTLKLVFNHYGPTLRRKVMFGTDFSVNLLTYDSYSEFLNMFLAAKIDDDIKLDMCWHNPERFLWE